MVRHSALKEKGVSPGGSVRDRVSCVQEHNHRFVLVSLRGPDSLSVLITNGGGFSLTQGPLEILLPNPQWHPVATLQLSNISACVNAPHPAGCHPALTS